MLYIPQQSPQPHLKENYTDGAYDLNRIWTWVALMLKFKIQALGLKLAGPPLPVGQTFRNHFIKFTSYFYSTKYNTKHYT